MSPAPPDPRRGTWHLARITHQDSLWLNLIWLIDKTLCGIRRSRLPVQRVRRHWLTPGLAVVRSAWTGLALVLSEQTEQLLLVGYGYA